MNEAVVVGCNLHVVHLTKRSQFPSMSESSKHRTVELEDLDSLFLDQRSATVTGQLALTG